MNEETKILNEKLRLSQSIQASCMKCFDINNLSYLDLLIKEWVELSNRITRVENKGTGQTHRALCQEKVQVEEQIKGILEKCQ